MKRISYICLIFFTLFFVSSCTIEKYDVANENQYFTEEMLENRNMKGLPKLSFTSSYLSSEKLLYFSGSPSDEWYLEVLEWIDNREDVVFWGAFVPSPNFLYDESVYKFDTYEEYISNQNNLVYKDNLGIAFTTMELTEEGIFQDVYAIIIQKFDSPREVGGSKNKYQYWLQLTQPTYPKYHYYG